MSVASAACGLASSLGALVALRLPQAIGAAMMQANSVALVTTSAPKSRMRFALGVQAGAQSVGLALGPTLGGLLTTTVGWRGVLGERACGHRGGRRGRYLLPRTREFSRPEKFDWPGTLLLVTWTSALLLALSAASGLSLPPWLAALLAVLAVAGAAAFVRREVSTAHPLIPVWLLRSRALAFALAGAACGYLDGRPTAYRRRPGPGHLRAREQHGDHAQHRRLICLSGRRLVSMARGIGTTFGSLLMALSLHLGTQSSQAGNPGNAAHHGYPGAEQARPAFIVLAVAAMAAAIALAGQRQARTVSGPVCAQAGRPREADPSGADR